MFTGIIQKICKIVFLEKKGSVLLYAIQLHDPVSLGSSISIDGTCQTVIKQKNNQVFFEAIEETLKLTTLGDLKLGDLVNIERAAKIGDEVGGHFVTGHIIDRAIIDSITNNIYTLTCDPKWMPYLLKKGYVALNGASLTLVDVDPKGKFSVHLIPETLKRTTFKEKKVGSKINLEIDYLVQAVIDSRSFF